MIHYYNHISDKKFLQLKQRLIALENSIVIPFCNKNSFHLDRERFYNETLAINLYRTKDGFTEAIGLYYVDESGKEVFSFGCTKYYDTESKRYSKEETIEKEKGIDFFEMNMKSLLARSLQNMESWSKNDLDRITELSR